MTRPRQHGEVELTGTGQVFYTNSKGETEPFDRAKHQRARPWARGPRRDTREFVV